MASDISIALHVSVSEQTLPPHDPSHGTQHAMVRRVITVRMGDASASFEQTDYGHPGRFNEWSPRGIDARLQPRAPQLAALREAVSPLLS